jgi:hypothetical protein
LAEGFGRAGTPPALRQAQGQFDTPAVHTYLASKLGLA